jgi:hypothetical protein
MTLHLYFCSPTSPLSKIEHIGPWGKPEFDLVNLDFSLCVSFKNRALEEKKRLRRLISRWYHLGDRVGGLGVRRGGVSPKKV